MHDIKIFKGWFLYRAELDKHQIMFYAMTKKAAVRKAQAFLDRLYGPPRGYIETIWYDPERTQ